MSKKLQVSIVAIVLLIFAFVYTSPYLVIYQIRQALKNEDSAAPFTSLSLETFVLK